MFDGPMVSLQNIKIWIGKKDQKNHKIEQRGLTAFIIQN